MTLHHVVVADPCWQFDDKLPGPKRGADAHYNTLPARDIEALRLPNVHTDALLFLWRVASMQEEALRVVRAWGFRPVSEIVWCKTKADGTARIGMGRYVRNSHESAIIATRGAGLAQIQCKSIPSWFCAPRTAHSAKPKEFFDLVERLARGPYLELFARSPRENWTTVGQELGSRLTLPLEAPR